MYKFEEVKEQSEEPRTLEVQHEEQPRRETVHVPVFDEGTNGNASASSALEFTINEEELRQKQNWGKQALMDC